MQRLNAYHEEVVPASADSAWALLRDWAGLLKWWPADAPFPILSCEAIGDPTDLPFGRRVELPGGALGEEYLIAADDESRRLYYQLTNGSLPGILNYLASTTVDEVDTGHALMCFSSNFDAPDDDDAAASKQMILSVYKAIANGIGRTASNNNFVSGENQSGH